MEKKINMARLHFLMAENQFRLGLDTRAIYYVSKTNKTLYKALKINPKNVHLKDFEKRLLYGNKVKLSTMKL